MHVGLFVACMHSVFISGLSAVPYIALILCIQWFYFKRLMGHKLRFLQPRQWHFDSSGVHLQLDGEWREVDIRSLRVLQSMIVIGFRHKKNERQWWASDTDIVMFDACDAETFRQARAYLRSNIQLKDNSYS